MTFADAVETYLARRQAEGIAYVNEAGCLRRLAIRVDDKDLDDLRAEDLRSYLRAEGFTQATASKRFTLISKLIKFHQDRGRALAFKMPPRPRFVPQEFTPHIYSEGEVERLLIASRTKEQGTIPRQTFEALILFLYGTGSSLHSAVRLKDEDLDTVNGLVRLDNQRGNGSRQIPLNRSVLKQLAKYARWKGKQGIQGERLFVRKDGRTLVIATFGSHFRTVLGNAKLVRRDGSKCRPRLYDFRATFAVHRISEWIRAGADLGRMLPALAAYMGMVDLTVTEQYLALSPERFRKELEKLSASAKT